MIQPEKLNFGAAVIVTPKTLKQKARTNFKLVRNTYAALTLVRLSRLFRRT